MSVVDDKFRKYNKQIYAIFFKKNAISTIF